MQSPSESLHEGFFRYTSGRWVWDEEQQLRARYTPFNVSELRKIAAKATGSDYCVSMTKLAEGNYNKVFRLVMSDGNVVLARIPNPNAGPPFYTTASEVATTELVRTVCNVPTPRVYGWSASAQNPVGSEYILMEEATGSQIGSVWNDLPANTKLNIMKEIVSIEAKLSSLTFSHYGVVYFASDSVEGAVPAQITSDVPLQLKEMVAEKFTIGPSVERGFWNKGRATMRISRGPWSNAIDYALSVGKREIAWIHQFAVPKPTDDPLYVSAAQNSPEAHIQLLQKYLNVCPYLMDVDEDIVRPVLWHTDLHSSNIFIEDGRITSVIDWQGVWAGPLFLQAQPSPLVNYQGPIVLERPANFGELDGERQADIKRQIFKSTLFQLYLLEMGERNPLLAKAFHLDHGKTRRLPVECAGDSWDDDIVALREALVKVERHWNELGISSDCPIHFTEEDIKQHLEDAEGWNEVQDFFNGIEDLVKRDGWTHHETYGEAVEFFSSLRKVGLQKMKGEEREKFEKETRWASR
ncbi:kinase-like domain-containing protein [Aspergillus avenaceus]|uniref:Kinase-like domain-containing protein n=1 Tax=Aspergillus avenaceus TaxID=36643 RepID=A0A5N6TKC9_ASPAV|nr:kinase-like domain-containing protein [Aspergillus avenaceus]